MHPIYLDLLSEEPPDTAAGRRTRRYLWLAVIVVVAIGAATLVAERAEHSRWLAKAAAGLEKNSRSAEPLDADEWKAFSAISAFAPDKLAGVEAIVVNLQQSAPTDELLLSELTVSGPPLKIRISGSARQSSVVNVLRSRLAEQFPSAAISFPSLQKSRDGRDGLRFEIGLRWPDTKPSGTLDRP